MPRTILIFLFGDLGDTILTVPAVRALRNRYPYSRLVLVGKTVAATYVGDLGLIDAAITVDKHAFDTPKSLLRPRAWRSLFALYRRLRRERADTVVIFNHLVTRWGAIKYACLALASGAGRRVGLDNGRGWFLTETVKDDGFGARHEAQYWLDVAAVLDARGPLRLEVPTTDADRLRAAHLLASIPRDKRPFAIHPGTGWYGPGRLWGADRFARVARSLMEEHDVRCVVVGSEADAAEAGRVVCLLDGDVVDLVGKTSVGELAAVLERCAVVIANDGGVGHLAAAVGTPVLSVFGPSNDRAWRPVGGEVVAADLPCRPCFYRDFEHGLPRGCATRECLALVEPPRVARRAAIYLQERSVAGH